MPPINPRRSPNHKYGSPLLIAGVDEAGRGPWAGPVVAAAVVLRRQRLPVRIDDSKRLTPPARTKACRVILASADVGIGVSSPEEIDRHNILQATLLAMQRAIDDLPRRPNRVVVDGTAAPLVGMPCETMIRGDQRHYAISCASIVAKVIRDQLMMFYDALYPGYAFGVHKGYGTPLHAAQLGRLGPCLLHRRSFAPIRERSSISLRVLEAHAHASPSARFTAT